MSTRETKIECIKRLFDKTDCKDQFLEYLYDEKILDKETFKENDHERDRLKAIYTALKNGVKNDSIMLLDFEWRLLPHEQIRIQIITSRGTKNFLYGY